MGVRPQSRGSRGMSESHFLPHRADWSGSELQKKSGRDDGGRRAHSFCLLPHSAGNSGSMKGLLGDFPRGVKHPSGRNGAAGMRAVAVTLRTQSWTQNSPSNFLGQTCESRAWPRLKQLDSKQPLSLRPLGGATSSHRPLQQKNCSQMCGILFCLKKKRKI